MKKLTNRGFTIIELLIASMVFTTILLLCLEGITRIGKVYIKNASVYRTNEFVKSFVGDITQQVRYGASVPQTSGVSPGPLYLCIAQNGYKITFNNVAEPIMKIADSNCSQFSDSSKYGSSSEKVAPNGMRVLQFSLSEINNIWNIKMRVALGDSDLLEDGSGVSLTNSSADFAEARCKTGIPGSEFCAVIELSTSASRRMQ